MAANNNSLKVTLSANQTLYIAGLPADSYTITEAKGDTYIVSAINGTTTTDNSTVAAVEVNKFTTTSFTNIVRGTGNFTISKVVDYPQGLSQEAINTITNKQFEITTEFKLNGQPLANKTYYKVIDGETSATEFVKTDEDGKAAFTLKHNEQVTLTGIPVDTVITATETLSAADEKNYDVTYYENGVLAANGNGTVSVTAHNTVSVIVDNEYKIEPEEVNIEVDVTKIVNDPKNSFSWTDKAFRFVLQKYNPNSTATDKWENISTSQMSITSQNGSGTFKVGQYGITKDHFTFTKEGHYYYRVKEVVEAMPGMRYDDKYHSFTVEVKDTNGDGKFEITVIPRGNEGDTETVKVNTYTAPSGNSTTHKIATTFTNTYNPDDALAEIIVNKTVDNRSETLELDLSGFEFKVFEVDGSGTISNENAVASAVTVTQTGVAKIALPAFDTTGTHRYVVKETKGTKAGWTYNTEPIYVDVVVTDDSNGSLQAQVYVTDKAGTVSVPQNATSELNVYFENIYEPVPASLDIPLNKRLIGRNLRVGEFTFMLADAKGQTNPVSLKQPLRITNSADTKFQLSFSKIGTYYYDITEVADANGDGKPDKSGVEYDNTTFRIAVAVEDKGTGTLTANYMIANVQGNTIIFENNYTPAPVSNAISGTKLLTGRVLKDGEFTFTLTEADDAQGTISQGATHYIAKNNLTAGSTDKGTFTFPEIIYDAVGTYYYVVAEEKGPEGNGVTYSNEKYVVTVVIADNQNGQLAVESVSHNTNQLVFNNSYKAANTTIDISGLKTLAGNRYIQANDFTFELYEATSTYTHGEIPLKTTKNDKDGKILFENIEFTAAGVYYYVIKENIPTEKIAGVTYDTAYYNVSVTVKDDYNGNLVAETPVVARITDEGTQQAVAIAFYNEYKAEPAVLKLGGIKKLSGRELVAGEFTFLLNKANEKFEVDKNVEVVKATNKADGTFAFDELKFTEAGTYYYVISEDSSQKAENVTYDSTKYCVTITVTDDTEKAKLVVDYTVKNAPLALELADMIEFRNKYMPPTPPANDPPKAPKTGDFTNSYPLFALAFISGGGIVGTVFYNKKKKEDN